MRSITEIEEWWPSFEATASSPGLRASIHSSGDTNEITGKARSAYWKSFLLLDDVSISQWPGKLENSRQAFEDLRKRFLDPLEQPNDSLVDPLSDTSNSPWNVLRKDEHIRQEINQDVERCLPDNLYFRQPFVQSILLDVLFVWTKLNPDIGYRQGMHELLAPIVWTVEKDSIDPHATHPSPKTMDMSNLITTIFDVQYVSHDSFAIFTTIMQQAKSSYEIEDSFQSAALERAVGSTPRQDAAITERSRKIYEEILPKVDPELSAHLKNIGIIPQIFLIRWIRLLFGREFSFDSVLQIWDKLFSEGISQLCIDLICVAMLLRIRWRLLDADNSEALQLLLHYPELPSEHGASTLVDDAHFLKTHCNVDGGHQLISTRTGRQVPLTGVSQAQSSLGGALGTTSSPKSKPRTNIEALLSDAAHNIASKGERWGVYQTVRDLSGELRKNVSNLQSKTHSRIQSRDSTPGRDQQKSARELLKRVDDLGTRNRSLAKILDGAVGELWQQQKETSADKPVDDRQMEAFTTAIAKVQFVQIYLEDPSLELPLHDIDQADTNTYPEPSDGQLSPKPLAVTPDQNKLASSTPGQSRGIKNHTGQGILTPEKPPAHAFREAPMEAAPQQTKLERAPLDQSSFSWMLGQEPQPSSTRGSFLSSQPLSNRIFDSKRSSRGQSAYLFGEEDDPNSPEKADKISGSPAARR